MVNASEFDLVVIGSGPGLGAIPGCTYCQPQVASIGMTELKAREMNEKIRVGRFHGESVKPGSFSGGRDS